MLKIYKIFLVWIIGIFLISAVGSYTFPKVQNTGLGAPAPDRSFNYFLSLAQWDGGNYLAIAQNGYLDLKHYAFSPLYPLFISFSSRFLSINLQFAGILVSLISLFAFLHIFHKYVSLVYDKKTATNTILTFLFFPTTFFCVLVYSESLFLLLLASSLYFVAKKSLIGYVSVALIPLARFVGVFLPIALIAVSISRKDLTKFTASLLTLAPFSVYLFCLYIISGQAFAPATVQINWGRFFIDPVVTITSYLLPLIVFKIGLNSFFDLTTTLLFIFILSKNIRRLPPALWVFSMLAILIPASTGTLTSMPRYALASVGAFIMVGEYLKSNPRIKPYVWGFSLAVQCLLLSLFITGHWVA